MVGHGRRVLQSATVLQVGRDPRRPKAVVTNRRFDPRRQGPSPHHGMRIGLRQDGRAQLPGTAPNRAKQWPFHIALDPGLYQVGMQVLFQQMVAGHGVLFAAFLPQPYPQPAVLLVDVLDLHAQRCTYTSKGKHHQRNQRPVAQPGVSADIDTVQQLSRFTWIEHRGFASTRCMARPAH